LGNVRKKAQKAQSGKAAAKGIDHGLHGLHGLIVNRRKRRERRGKMAADCHPPLRLDFFQSQPELPQMTRIDADKGLRFNLFKVDELQCWYPG
jgi:hypothetical protein